MRQGFDEDRIAGPGHARRAGGSDRRTPRSRSGAWRASRGERTRELLSALTVLSTLASRDQCAEVPDNCPIFWALSAKARTETSDTVKQDWPWNVSLS